MGKLAAATASVASACAMAKLAFDTLESIALDIKNNRTMRQQLIDEYRKKAQRTGGDPNDVVNDAEMAKLVKIADNLAKKWNAAHDTLSNSKKSFQTGIGNIEEMLENRSWKAKLNLLKNKKKVEQANTVLAEANELLKRINKLCTMD